MLKPLPCSILDIDLEFEKLGYNREISVPYFSQIVCHALQYDVIPQVPEWNMESWFDVIRVYRKFGGKKG